MKKLCLSLLLVSLMGLFVLPTAAQDAMTPAEICAANTPAETPSSLQFSAPEQVLEPGVNYQAIFCTEKGAVYVDLFENETPITVNSFVFLAQNGYYNNTVFHRVIQDFMAQGGDAVGNPRGTGGPGYQFEDEPVGFLTFDTPGWLAMANAGAGTNGSQFFITTVPTEHLNYKHTIFGRVLEGQEVVDSLPDNQTDTSIQTKLDTVVIITDPASVKSAYTSADLPSEDIITQAVGDWKTSVSDTLNLFGLGAAGDILAVDEAQTSVLTPEAWQAQLSETVAPETIEAYYGNHALQYHGSLRLVSAKCDMTNLPVGEMTYSFDAYATEAEAADAQNDPALTALFEAQGFEAFQSNLGLKAYRSTVQACDQEMILVATVLRHGRFVVVVQGSFTDSGADDQNITISDALLHDLIPLLIEFPLKDIFRAELQ